MDLGGDGEDEVVSEDCKALCVVTHELYFMPSAACGEESNVIWGGDGGLIWLQILIINGVVLNVLAIWFNNIIFTTIFFIFVAGAIKKRNM